MKKIMALVCAVLMLASCGARSAEPSSNSKFLIMLYGEAHSDEKILDKEIEIWKNYYDNDGARHLFIEVAYYTAEFLNLWMQETDDEIIDKLFEDIKGTAGATEASKNFYKKIKEHCPKTIFHGTDVGHQYNTTGARYKKYLEANGLVDTEQYILTLQAGEQGEKYYESLDHVYRENKMAENFIREYEKIKGEKIMGIYGNAHTNFEAMDYMTQTVPCMAAQLKEKYGEDIDSVDLVTLLLAKDKPTQPISTEEKTVAGKTYTASYFGKNENVNANIRLLKYYRLENAYEDFKSAPITDNYMPCEQYPVEIESDQIYYAEYITSTGESGAFIFRYDNLKLNTKSVMYELDAS